MPDLDLPIPGVTPGPEWATKNNAALNALNEVMETGRLSQEGLEAELVSTAADLNPEALSDSFIAQQIATPGSQTATELSGAVEGEVATKIATSPDIVARPDKLRRTRVGLANTPTRRSTIFAIGDSVTEGDAATARDRRWVDVLRAVLQRTFPSINGEEAVGFIPANYFTTSFPQVFSFTGTTSQYNYFGPGGRSRRMEPSSEATATIQGASSIDVMYAKATFTGRMEILIDGVSQGTTQTSAASSLDGFAVRVVMPDTGPHEVKVRPFEAFPIMFEGVIVNNGNEASGVRVIDAGHWGWTTSHFLTGGGPSSLGQLASYLDPDLVTIALTANDYSGQVPIATYKANIVALIAAVRASGATPDIMLIAYPERSNVISPAIPYSAYVDALAEVAAADMSVTLLDLRRYMDKVAEDTLSLWADNVHPNDRGGRTIGQYIAAFLSAGVTPQPKPRDRESVFIPASAFTPSAGSPAMAVGSGAYTGLAYDASAQEAAVTWTRLPVGWTKVNVELYWLHYNSTPSGDVIWRINLRQQPIGAVTDANLADVTKQVTAPAQFVSQRLALVSGQAISPDKLTGISVIRMAAGAGDTFAADSILVGVRLVRVE
jgi:lysophospholipase L1-like esterase